MDRVMEQVSGGVVKLDLAKISVRELNQYLHHELVSSGAERVEILHPDGQHSLAVGLDADVACTLKPDINFPE